MMSLDTATPSPAHEHRVARQRVGVIANLGARSLRRDGLDREGLRRDLGAHGVLAEFDSPESLRAAVVRLRRARVRTVVVVGGDGTLSVVATELARRWRSRTPLPTLLPLPGGSMNSTARALGVPPYSPSEAVRRVCDGAPWERRRLQSLVVDAGWTRPRLGFLFANGLCADYIDYARRNGGTTAWNSLRVGALLTGGALLDSSAARGAFAERRAEVCVDGETRRFETFKTLVVLGAIHLPAPLAPFPDPAAAAPGEVAYLLNAMPRETLLRNALPVLRGTARSPLHSTGYARHLRVRCAARFVLDGEVFESDGRAFVSVAAGPRFECLTAPLRTPLPTRGGLA